MKEDFLHYIWKHKKFNSKVLRTTNNEDIEILHLGQHNFNSGPDFFNAQIRISNQLWAGNVEIHIKSSDWYLHNHEKDSAYDNVILHVVWEDDVEVYRRDNSKIPTLEIKQFIDEALINNYKKLMQSKSWINCEKSFSSVDDFLLDNWLERLYIDRLERKHNDITNILKASHNDWEATLFKMLAKNFGLKINGDAFLSLANSFPFSVVRKLQNDVLSIEALFFGQTNLIDNDYQSSYYLDLQQQYQFLKQKFGLSNQGVIPIQFFRLRPPNFPTLRLSQLANLFNKETNLFSKLIEIDTKDDFYTLFNISATEFWNTHYTFSKESKPSKKKLSKAFIDLLLINTVIPIKFSYAKANGKDIEGHIFNLIKSLKQEQNSITKKFLSLKEIKKSALTSQSLIQLKLEFCDKNKCLQCAIGNDLITKNK